MQVTFILYDGMTALDLVGPYQVFAGAPGVDVKLAATVPGSKRTDSGMVIRADVSTRDVDAPDIVVVPGTVHPQAATSDPELLAWLSRVAAAATWTCSVCTGSLALAAAGLLRGRRATTHWLARDALRALGATPVDERVVFDDRIVTSAGVSAGIDMALAVAARTWSADVAETIQLAIEYDPQPPFAAGSPRTARPAIVRAATDALVAASGRVESPA
jgi:transcriptional regulator GlxA family with amidase domain